MEIYLSGGHEAPSTTTQHPAPTPRRAGATAMLSAAASLFSRRLVTFVGVSVAYLLAATASSVAFLAVVARGSATAGPASASATAFPIFSVAFGVWMLVLTASLLATITRAALNAAEPGRSLRGRALALLGWGMVALSPLLAAAMLAPAGSGINARLLPATTALALTVASAYLPVCVADARRSPLLTSAKLVARTLPNVTVALGTCAAIGIGIFATFGQWAVQSWQLGIAATRPESSVARLAQDHAPVLLGAAALVMASTLLFAFAQCCLAIVYTSLEPRVAEAAGSAVAPGAGYTPSYVQAPTTPFTAPPPPQAPAQLSAPPPSPGPLGPLPPPPGAAPTWPMP